jgi:curli biogenesis system outer membrane secretion channel CsgG
LALSSVAKAASDVDSPKRISVTRFSQEVSHILEHCHGWEFTDQNQLQTELESELSSRGLKVLERRDIRKIYGDEYELPNLDRSSSPKRGKFLSAQYTVTGGITELGVCEESEGSGLQLGGIVSLLGGPAADLRVGKRSATSRVKLIAQLVSTETGEVLKSFEAHSEISDSGYSVAGGAMGIGARHEARERPPIERASNEAIHDLSVQIARYVER